MPVFLLDACVLGVAVQLHSRLGEGFVNLENYMLLLVSVCGYGARNLGNYMLHPRAIWCSRMSHFLVPVCGHGVFYYLAACLVWKLSTTVLPAYH